MTDHAYVYIEPTCGATLTGVCSCGPLLNGFGITSLAEMLATHIKAVNLASLERRMALVATIQEERKLKGYGK